MDSTAFVRFWQTDLARNGFLSFATRDDLQVMRLVSHDFAEQVAPHLFKNIYLHFDTNSFSRQARLSALERIGHHIKSLSFVMPHSAETFLPPLLAPDTMEEISFLYEPQIPTSRPTSSSSASSASKYGSWEMNDLLIKHYPPLFHAATNISSFIRAISAMTNLQAVRISCPQQVAAQRYRRDVVDYALISLRVALEQTNPINLHSLYLDQIHPSAVLSLRPQLSLGASPASTRVWRRISKLSITMDSFAYGRDLPSDHLKILHTYLQSFTGLNELDFHWIGEKGPCPLSLDAEPCMSRPASLDCANACPQSCILPSCKPIKFRGLHKMRLTNAALDSSQAAAFIMTHRKVLHEFKFEECHLRSGTWDDALAPLSRIVGNDGWKQKQEEVMDVPLMLSPVATRKEECVESTMWDDVHQRRRGLEMLRKIGLRTRDIVPGHVRRLFRATRVAWY